MKNIFYFWEKIKGFDVRVLNEREVKASAGILFFFAMIAFMNAWLTGNFYITKIFVIAFLIDFFIRIFINPKYSPSLLLGRIFVRNQQPEYVGAPQKRFAWAIGFALAITMFFLAIINNVIGPINLLVCLTCLTLLFFETAFGICLGCKVYNLFNSKKAKLCPGGTCEVSKKEEIQKINFTQIVIVLLFIVWIIFLVKANIIPHNILTKNESNIKYTNEWTVNKEPISTGINNNCEVPDWAIKMGHEELYKLHHGCNQ